MQAYRVPMLGGHPEFTLGSPGKQLSDAWRELVADWANEPSKPICAEYWSRITTALDDDLDTPAALRVLRELARDGEIPAGSKFETFVAADRILALDLVSLVGQHAPTDPDQTDRLLGIVLDGLRPQPSSAS